MECFLCCFCVADSCIICVISSSPESSLKKFWISVWVLVNICLLLGDSFNFWIIAEFLSTLIFTKLTWHAFWLTQAVIPFYIIGSVFSPNHNINTNNYFGGLCTIQCFAMLYIYSFYNGGLETLLFISPLLYGFIFFLINRTFKEGFTQIICIWFFCFVLDTFSSLISLWYLVHLFFVYIVVPTIEYPVILGLLSAFVTGIEKLVNKIENDHYTIHTRGKSKRQIITFMFYEMLYVILLVGSLVGVYFSQSVIVYLHGYCPIFVSILTMIGYSYPFALGLTYPREPFNDALPAKILIFLNTVPVAIVLITIKVIFLS